MNDFNDILNIIKNKSGAEIRKIIESGVYSAAEPRYEPGRHNIQAHSSYGSENAGHTMFHSNAVDVNAELLSAALAGKSRLGLMEGRKSDASALVTPQYYEDFPSSAGLSSTGLLPHSEQRLFNYGHYSGSFAEEPASTQAYSNQMQRKPLTLDLDDIDDEDEFLYGKSEGSSALKEKVSDQNKLSDPFESNTSYFGQRSNFLEVDSDYQVSSLKFTKPIVGNTKLSSRISKCHSELVKFEEGRLYNTLSLLNTSRNTSENSGLSNSSVEEKMRMPLMTDKPSSHVTESLRESDKMHIPSSMAGNRPPSDKTRKSRFDQKPDTPLSQFNEVNSKAQIRCKNNSPEADQGNPLLLNKKEINDSAPSKLPSHPVRKEIDVRENISMNLKSLSSGFSENHSERKINILSSDADPFVLNEVSNDNFVSLSFKKKVPVPAKKNLQALDGQNVVAIERNVGKPEQLQTEDYRAEKLAKERYYRNIEVSSSNSNNMNAPNTKRKPSPDKHGGDSPRYTDRRREHLHDRTASRHKKNYSPTHERDMEKHKDSKYLEKSRQYDERNSRVRSRSPKRRDYDRNPLDRHKSHNSRKESTERRRRPNRWSRSRSREVSRSPSRYSDWDKRSSRHSSTGTPRRRSPDDDSRLSGDSKADSHHNTHPKNSKKEDLVSQSSSFDKCPSEKAKESKNNREAESESTVDDTETTIIKKKDEAEPITDSQICCRTSKPEIIFDKNVSLSVISSKESLDAPNEKSTADKLNDFLDQIMQNRKVAADSTQVTSSVPIVDTSDSSSFVYNEPIDTNVTSQMPDPLLTSYMPNYGYANPSMSMPPYVNNSLTYGSNMPYNYQAPVSMYDAYMHNPYYQHANYYPIPNRDMAPMISPPDVSRNAYESNKKSTRVSNLEEILVLNPDLKESQVKNKSKINLKSQSPKVEVNKSANEECENRTDNLSPVLKGKFVPLKIEESLFLKEPPTSTVSEKEQSSVKKGDSPFEGCTLSDLVRKEMANIMRQEIINPVKQKVMNTKNDQLAEEISKAIGDYFAKKEALEKESSTPGLCSPEKDISNLASNKSSDTAEKMKINMSEDSSPTNKKENVLNKVDNEDVIVEENNEPRNFRQMPTISPEKSNKNDVSTNVENIAKLQKLLYEHMDVSFDINSFHKCNSDLCDQEIILRFNSRYRALDSVKRTKKNIEELIKKCTNRAQSIDTAIKMLKERVKNADKAVDVEEVIRRLAAVELKKLKEVKNNQEVISKIFYLYVDCGPHWCRLCNRDFNSIPSKLEHLQTHEHKQMMDPYQKPWSAPKRKEQPSSSNERVKKETLPLKGLEFVTPIDGFYCTLCKERFLDMDYAEHHLRSREHNKKYYEYLVKNPDYGIKYAHKRRISLKARETEGKKTVSSAVANSTKRKNKDCQVKEIIEEEGSNKRKKYLGSREQIIKNANCSPSVHPRPASSIPQSTLEKRSLQLLNIPMPPPRLTEEHKDFYPPPSVYPSPSVHSPFVCPPSVYPPPSVRPPSVHSPFVCPPSVYTPPSVHPPLSVHPSPIRPPPSSHHPLSVPQSTLEKIRLQLLNIPMPPPKLTEEEKDFLLLGINKDDMIPLALPRRPPPITDSNIGIRVPFPPPSQLEQNIARNDAVMANATTGGSVGTPKLYSLETQKSSLPSLHAMPPPPPSISNQSPVIHTPQSSYPPSSTNIVEFPVTPNILPENFHYNVPQQLPCPKNNNQTVLLDALEKDTSYASCAVPVKTIVTTPILSASQKQKLLHSVTTNSTVLAPGFDHVGSSSLTVSSDIIITSEALKSATASVKTEAATFSAPEEQKLLDNVEAKSSLPTSSLVQVEAFSPSLFTDSIVTSEASKSATASVKTEAVTSSAPEEQKLLDNVEAKSSLPTSSSVQVESFSPSLFTDSIVTSEASKSATTPVKIVAALRNKEAKVIAADKKIQVSDVNVALVTVDDKNNSCGHAFNLEISVIKQKTFLFSSVEAPDLLSSMPSNESISSKQPDDINLSGSCANNLTNLSLNDNTKVKDGIFDSNVLSVSPVDNNNTENRRPDISIGEGASTNFQMKQIDVAEVKPHSFPVKDLNTSMSLAVLTDFKADAENEDILDSNPHSVSSVDINNIENCSPAVSIEKAASTNFEAKQISVAEVNLLSSSLIGLNKSLHLTVPIDSTASNENEKFFTVDGYSSGVCDSSTELHADESSKSMMAGSSTTIEAADETKAVKSPRSTVPFTLLTNVIENLRVLTAPTDPEVALNIGDSYSFAVESAGYKTAIMLNASVKSCENKTIANIEESSELLMTEQSSVYEGNQAALNIAEIGISESLPADTPHEDQVVISEVCENKFMQLENDSRLEANETEIPMEIEQEDKVAASVPVDASSSFQAINTVEETDKNYGSVVNNALDLEEKSLSLPAALTDIHDENIGSDKMFCEPIPVGHVQGVDSSENTTDSMPSLNEQNAFPKEASAGLEGKETTDISTEAMPLLTAENEDSQGV